MVVPRQEFQCDSDVDPLSEVRLSSLAEQQSK